jgi:hypothetical protein
MHEAPENALRVDEHIPPGFMMTMRVNMNDIRDIMRLASLDHQQKLILTGS